MGVSPIAEKVSDVVLALAPDANAPRRARHALHEARLPDDLEHTVDLLATEVVANAVRHVEFGDGQQIVFAASFVSDFIRVEVADPGPGFAPEEAAAGRGFGLRMVDKLASRWGVEPTPEGSRVWFEVDRRSKRRFDR